MDRLRRLSYPLAVGALPIVVLFTGACAAPMRQIAPPPAATSAAPRPTRAAAVPAQGRPLVGVAFGGGSARGLAHVGVIRWFQEHRIPIDMAAGTSMGALVGGAFATGLDADELDALLVSIDWDTIFGSSNFAYKNIRRKADARAYPSHLEFGLKSGIVLPPSLNDGQQVDRLLARMTAAYDDVDTFDELPTPFRTVATDLVSATQFIFDRGPLAVAMRASMSLPLIFPAVEANGRVLVDGGLLNNVPADVVRAMGATKVVAINVGDLNDPSSISLTMTRIVDTTLTAMMRSTTRTGIGAADVRIDVPLAKYTSLDWRRSRDLAREGYMAAEAMRDQLLPLAVSESAYAEWQRERMRRRRASIPIPQFISSQGLLANDQHRIDALLRHHVGKPLDVDRLEKDLDQLTGEDRYESISWRVAYNAAGESGVLVNAHPKPHAPPFLMMGLNIENTTSADFRITATARYLAYDLVLPGSELRLDGTLGSLPSAGAELYQPFGRLPWFGTAAAGVTTDRGTSFEDDQILARYGVTRWRASAGPGVNLGRISDLRFGAYIQDVDAEVEIGDPGLPEFHGLESGLTALWRFDGQDNLMVPSAGSLASVQVLHVLESPNVALSDSTIDVNGRVTQLSGNVSQFWSVGRLNRLFVSGGLGTSFDRQPLPTNEFILGSPLMLGAYRSGELRGAHYFLASGGYLRQVGRLPDFIGGPVFGGAWVENGDAFNDWGDATWRTNVTTAVMMDTLVGPVMLAGSAGFDGRWRTYIGVGRIFSNTATRDR